MDVSNLGEIIYLAIHRGGMNQQQLAAALKVSPNTVTSWINGETSPKASELREIARITKQFSAIQSYFEDDSARKKDSIPFAADRIRKG